MESRVKRAKGVKVKKERIMNKSIYSVSYSNQITINIANNHIIINIKLKLIAINIEIR